MKNPRLYRRSKQKEGAKRMEFLLDVRCVQILNDLKTRHNKSYTKIVENLILNSQISFYKQQKITSALGSLAMLCLKNSLILLKVFKKLFFVNFPIVFKTPTRFLLE